MSEGIVNNSSADQLISIGSLSGDGGIVQNGTGTLRLDLGSASYTGNTVVNSGTLRAFGFAGATPLGDKTLVLNGGTLGNVGALGGSTDLFLSIDNEVDINGDIGIDIEGSSGRVQLDGNVDLGADTRVITVTRDRSNPFFGDFSVYGTISGTGGVTYVTNGNGAEVVYGGSGGNANTIPA